jgi:hypothetical protein
MEMKETLTDSQARVRYTRKIGRGSTLVGFEWGEGEPRDIKDFIIESLGEIECSDCDSRREVGWVIYDKFDSSVGNIVKLK